MPDDVTVPPGRFCRLGRARGAAAATFLPPPNDTVLQSCPCGSPRDGICLLLRSLWWVVLALGGVQCTRSFSLARSPSFVPSHSASRTARSCAAAASPHVRWFRPPLTHIASRRSTHSRLQHTHRRSTAPLQLSVQAAMPARVMPTNPTGAPTDAASAPPKRQQTSELTVCISLASLFDFEQSGKISQENWQKGMATLMLEELGTDPKIWSRLVDMHGGRDGGPPTSTSSASRTSCPSTHASRCSSTRSSRASSGCAIL